MIIVGGSGRISSFYDISMARTCYVYNLQNNILLQISGSLRNMHSRERTHPEIARVTNITPQLHLLRTNCNTRITPLGSWNASNLNSIMVNRCTTRETRFRFFTTIPITVMSVNVKSVGLQCNTLQCKMVVKFCFDFIQQICIAFPSIYQ